LPGYLKSSFAANLLLYHRLFI